MAAKTKSTRSKTAKTSEKTFKVNKTKLQKITGAAKAGASPRQTGKLAAN